MDINIVSKGEINTNDVPFINNSIEKLLIGRDDKTISLLENGSLIPILTQNIFTKITDNNGYVEIPINGNYPLLIQWGSVEVQPSSPQDFNFYKTFNDSPFILNGSFSIISEDNQLLKIDKKSNSQFTVKVINGTTNAKIFWLAIGV